MKAVSDLAVGRDESEARDKRGDAQSERLRPKARGGNPPSQPRVGKVQRDACGGGAECNLRGPRGGLGAKDRHERKFLRSRLRAGKFLRPRGVTADFMSNSLG